MMRNVITAAAWLCLLPAATLAEPAIDDIISDAGLTAGPVAVRDRDRWRSPKTIVVREVFDLPARLTAAFPGVRFVAVDDEVGALAHIADADAVIGYCSDAVARHGKHLQWVQIFSSGAEDCLEVEALGSDRILLTNMQKMASPTIGEHAVAMAMSLARRLPTHAKIMAKGDWNTGIASGMRSLSGKTVLVVGLGGIGTAAAKRAHGIGMRVLATRNSSREGPDFVEYVGLSDELLELAGRADVIINALPLTPQTTGLFDREFFDAVKPGALFVNVARGGSVVTAELVAALQDGRIGGAGLDVTEPEPLPAGHVLWEMDNVIITPHVAGFGGERDHYPVVIEENVRRFVAGDALLNVVDPERGY